VQAGEGIANTGKNNDGISDSFSELLKSYRAAAADSENKFDADAIAPAINPPVAPNQHDETVSPRTLVERFSITSQKIFSQIANVLKSIFSTFGFA
jgi:hypothetical protein